MSGCSAAHVQAGDGPVAPGVVRGAAPSVPLCLGHTVEDIAVDASRVAGRGDVSWALRLGGSGRDEAAAVAMDRAGNIVIAGQFSGTLAAAGVVLASRGPSDAFLAKLSPGGEVLWLRALGGAGSDMATGVAVEPSGAIAVLGAFEGGMRVAGVELRARGVQDAFVARYSADGDPRWAVSLGSPAWTVAGGMAVDVSGDIAVTGTFTGTLHIGEETLTSAGEADAFVARLAPDGDVLWAVRMGERGWDEAHAVAVDEDGGVIAGGAIAGIAGSHGLVARYTADGELSWSQRVSGEGDHHVLAVAAAPGGAVVAAGAFVGTIGHGAGALASQGERDVFVASYGPGGTLSWARRHGGARMDAARSVAILPSGDIVLSGAVSADASLGGEVLHAGHLDLFVARHGAGGEHQWSRILHGAGAGTRAMIAADTSTIVVAGGFARSLDLGGGHMLDSQGSFDAFVVALPAVWRTGLAALRTGELSW